MSASPRLPRSGPLTAAGSCVLLLLGACDRPSPPPAYLRAPDRPGAVVEAADAPDAAARAAPTQVVVLGTGTPVPDPHRAGAGVAVIHRGRAYLFDAGAGVVRSAVQARHRHDLPALYPTRIGDVFFTHLHSDHLFDYPELAHTLWWRRARPLRAWGPPGLGAVTDGLQAMLAIDTRLRVEGRQPVPEPDLYRVEVTEIRPGPVLAREDLRIEAFAVDHGDIRPAYGYRVVTRDLTVVISGDTGPSPNLIAHARGADLLIHEVIPDAALATRTASWRAYHGAAHTPATELARIAAEVRPGLLVLVHGLFFGEPEGDVLEELRAAGYEGPVVLAEDLDRFDAGGPLRGPGDRR